MTGAGRPEPSPSEPGSDAPTGPDAPRPPDWADPAVILTRVGIGGFAGRMGLEFLEVGPARVVARIPVEGNTQPYGLLHGGASAALCETVGSVGAAVRAGFELLVMGMELNISHLRSAKDGWVTATGTPLRQGSMSAVWDIRVADDDGNAVAVARLTVAIRRPELRER